MNSKKIIITVLTVWVISILVACAMAPAVDADESKTVTVRALSVYQGSATAESTGVYNYNDSLYFFNDGSNNEEIFLNYIKDGKGTIPTSDDNNNLVVNSKINIYYLQTYHPYDTISIKWIGQTVYKTVDMSKNIYSIDEIKFYFEGDSTRTLNVVFGNNIECRIYTNIGGWISNYNLTSNVTEIIDSNGSGYAIISFAANNISEMFITITYSISGNYDPQPDNGNGSIIIMGLCFILFIVGLIIMLLSMKKPDWSK